jgi:hypothetical protein
VWAEGGHTLFHTLPKKSSHEILISFMIAFRELSRKRWHVSAALRPRISKGAHCYQDNRRGDDPMTLSNSCIVVAVAGANRGRN